MADRRTGRSAIALNDAASTFVSMARLWLLVFFACTSLSCAGGYNACKKDPITGSERCQPGSSNTGDAVGTAAAAGAVWAVTGCTVNGCEPPLRCNPKTKMCERIPCGEGLGNCPPNLICDPQDHVCK